MITPQAPPAMESTDEPTDATRHLCAGVYVDERFRDLVIDKVCTAPHRRVAPSYGFDIVPVMHHAWRAAALTAILRVTLVAAMVMPAFVGALPTTVLITCAIALFRLLRFAILLRDVDRGSRSKRESKRRGLGQIQSQGYLFRLLLPRRYSAMTPAFKRIRVAALSLVLTGLTVALAEPGDAVTAADVAAGMTLMCLVVGAARQLILNRILRAPTLRPAHLSGRQRVADIQQRHTCAVYRRPRHRDDEEEDQDDLTVFTLFGEESPFIGAGELVYQWNPPMSIQLLRPGGDDDAPLHEREHLVPPFQTHELVDYLREAVQLLDTDSQDVRLPVQVRDRVYVAETDVAADHSLIPQAFDEADLRALINTPGSKQHHFLEFTAPTEGSEYMATVLLHVSLQGRTLSLSTAACALAHTPRSFQRTEEFGHHGATAVAWAAIRELAALPIEVQKSWRAARYLYALGKAAVFPRDLSAAPIRNILIGSRVSIREESSQDWSKIQLQKSDILGQMKSIERRLLRATSDFLYSKDVDISEFTNRALNIINSGIFNFGDNNNFSHNAVGDAAQVSAPATQPASSSNSSSGGSK